MMVLEDRTDEVQNPLTFLIVVISCPAYINLTGALKTYHEYVFDVCHRSMQDSPLETRNIVLVWYMQ